MKKSVVIFLHIGFWACYLVLGMVILAAIFATGNASDSRIELAFKVILFFALVPSAISFYSFYFLLFPKDFQRHKISQSIIYGILICLGAGVIGFTMLVAITEGECVKEDEGDTVFGVILFISFIALINGIVALVIKGFITWFEEIKLKEDLKQKNHEMELALVKSQLDPHFLFNTINNIDVLIIKDATEASNYLNKLSDIMRFMLFETKTDKILLSKEIEYITKYIELQKIRTSNLSYVNFRVSGIPDGNKIAPMVFIPFIENAFKHTTNKKIENAICVTICIKNETIQLVCENKFDPNRKVQQDSNGLGNDLIQKRLKLIYPEKHILEVVNQNGLYSVNLTIQND